MKMRTTLNLDDSMMEKAASLTGVREKTSLVHLGLQALIAQENHRRLAELGWDGASFACRSSAPLKGFLIDLG